LETALDSRKLSELTEVRVGTLLSWVQRGFVPGTGVEVSGRRRDLDPKTAMHIAVMAELMPYGLGSQWASYAAQGAVDAYLDGQPDCMVVYLKTEKKWKAQVNEETKKSIMQLDAEERPDVFTVINIARIAEKIQQAEAEYQSSRKTRDAKADG